jgi:hypothetical protein
MNTKKQLNNILNKFPKKTELENHKINLSKISDVEEFLSVGFAMQEFIEEALEIAQENLTKARDITKFDMKDAYINADGVLAEIKEELDELGVDSPKYKQLVKESQDLKDLVNKMEDAIRSTR